MYVLPIWYLPALIWAMWIGTLFRPVIEGAEDIAELQSTESTLV
jgi:hypothetical protein